MNKTLTLSVITGYFLLMGAMGAAASVPHKIANESKDNARRQIIMNISCPAFIKDNTPSNDVRAVVQIDEKGKVTVTDINSANPKLLDYVAAQLQNMTIKNPGSTEKFILIIHFKVA